MLEHMLFPLRWQTLTRTLFALSTFTSATSSPQVREFADELASTCMPFTFYQNHPHCVFWVCTEKREGASKNDTLLPKHDHLRRHNTRTHTDPPTHTHTHAHTRAHQMPRCWSTQDLDWGTQLFPSTELWIQPRLFFGFSKAG